MMFKKMPRVKSLIYIIGVCFVSLFSLAVHAETETDKHEHDSIYKVYLQLYSSFGKSKEFYKTSAQLAEYYRTHDDVDNFYKVQCNEVLYDIEHDQSYLAVEKANKMLKRMKEEGYEKYGMVYVALGMVFESRGLSRMAEHFYHEAISDDNDELMTIGIYSRLANLLKFSRPDEANKWNEKYAESSRQHPHYRQAYLFLKAIIAFIKDDQEAYEKASKVYQQYHEQNKEQLDEYGQLTIRCMNEAHQGHYEEAIDLLRLPNPDIDNIGRHDLRICVYRMAGQYDQALRQSMLRAQYVDSLNADMLFRNLNQIQAETGVVKLQAEANSRQLKMLYLVLVLAGIIILMLIIYTVLRRRAQDSMAQKNEQLRMALSMAEESDKMKTEFVRNVSHEIRTPLNAINGFNEIINNNSFELNQEERTELINRIKNNVQAITNIVDEMLQMAERGSSDFYPKTGYLYPNHFLADLIYSQRNHVNSNIELYYTTKVINRFSIHTNQDGVKKIIDHLLSNAIKFTTQGFIELHCEEAPDKKHVLITLTDTGCGIAPEKQEKIFEQFYKVDMFQQGIGLGLTVSKKIARKLGGDLVLDNNYTDGARFILSLPIE